MQLACERNCFSIVCSSINQINDKLKENAMINE